jgi:hypothetical protein
MVVPPKLEAADESRMAVVRLDTLPQASWKPDLLADTERIKVIGQRMRRLAIDQHKNLAASIRVLGAAMKSRGDTGRFVDTIGTLLVGAWLLVERRVMTPEDASKLLDQQPVDAHRERVEDSTDERECVNWILGHHVWCDFADKKSGELTVSELLRAAQSAPRMDGQNEAGRLLERYGLKLSQDGHALQVSTNASGEGVRRLFRDSKYANGGHASVLRRIPGAKESTPRFCGQSARAIAVPMSFIRAEVSKRSCSAA